MRILRSIIFAAAGYLAARSLGKRRAGSVSSRRGSSPRSSGPARRGRAGAERAWGSVRERAQGVSPKHRSVVKTYAIRFAKLLPILAVGGFLVAASGIISIKASSGHWGITEWFLQFSKSRSVATHSMGVKTPPLDDPALVLKGAGHFETGCLPCHGGPGREAPRIARQMTPLPPMLATMVPERDPNELFYILKHGIKFTGMPAWPALSRDDEVWAMVAFLLRLPDLDGEEYAALVFGEEVDADMDVDMNADADMDADLDPSDTTLAASTPLQGLLYPEEIPSPVSDRCGRCHGADGAGRGLGAFPKLAGQRPAYLFAALRAYAEGERHSGIMQPVAAGLGEAEMREIALFYSRLTTARTAARPVGVNGAAQAPDSIDASGAASAGPAAAAAPAGPSTGGAVDTLAVRRGERIAHEGLPRERVPACAGCHGPSAHPKNPFYPILAGQYADYIALQLDLFKDDRRGGSAYSRLMHPTADELTEEQVRDVALYYGSLNNGSLNNGSLNDGSLNDGSLGSDLEQSGAAAADTTR